MVVVRGDHDVFELRVGQCQGNRIRKVTREKASLILDNWDDKDRHPCHLGGHMIPVIKEFAEKVIRGCVS